MTKPASELIALADELSFAAENTQGCLYSQRKMLHAAAGHIRTAANQSGSERAGVDALRDDPSSDERWQAGLDFAMIQLCGVMGVDPHDVHWDAATEEVEGDVRAVMGNILRAKMGEDWSPPAQPAPAHGTVVTPVLVPDQNSASGHRIRWMPSEAPSTHEPDGAVREALSSLVRVVSNMRVPQNIADAALQVAVIGPVLERAKAALSPKIAAAETSPGDAAEKVNWTPFEDGTAPWSEDEQFEERAKACKSRCKQYGYTCGQGDEEDYEYEGECDDCDRDAQEVLRKKYLKPTAIDRLDVKAEAKSQEPVAVVVKPLEWTQSPPPAHEHEPFVYWAAGVGGHYRAERNGLLWMAHDAFVWTQHANQKAAKAAAQSDYEQRIRSALIHTKPEAPAVSVDAIKQVQAAIEQAIDCIRGETPEDCSDEEAKADTLSKLREADTAIAALIDGER